MTRHRGGLLNVASIAAFLPGPGMAVYYATKAYVLSFTEALHQEWAGRGIKVTALCPGPVPTEFQARAKLDLPNATKMIELPPDRVAQIGYDGLMRGQRVVVAGLGQQARGVASCALPPMRCSCAPSISAPAPAKAADFRSPAVSGKH